MAEQGLGRAGKVTLAAGLIVGNVVVVWLAIVAFINEEPGEGFLWLLGGAGAVALLSIVLATVVETLVGGDREDRG